MVKSDFLYYKELPLKERIRSPLGNTLKAVPILKREAIEEDHCLFQ